MPNSIVNKRVTLKKAAASSVVYDSWAQSYFDFTDGSADELSAARKAIYNDLFVGLKADGNATKLDALWIMAAPTEGAAIVSLIEQGDASGGLFTLANINAVTFTSDRGFTGNGTTSYLNTQFVPSSHGINFTQNKASYGFYSRTTSSIDAIDMGSVEGGAGGDPSGYVAIQWSDGTAYANINCLATGQIVYGSGLNSRAFFSIRRTTSIRQSISQNGIEVDFNTSSSTSMPTIEQFIGSYNHTSTAMYFSTRQYAAAYYGSSDIDDLKLYNRIQTFMTAIGAQV